MSDSAEGGDGGGMAGAGQDSEGDSEPPQQVPPLLPESDSAEVEDASEEGAPPSAKRSRMSDEEKGLGGVVESAKVYEEIQAQVDFLQETPIPSAQSTVLLP